MVWRLGGVFGLRAAGSQSCVERFGGGLEDLEKIEDGIACTAKKLLANIMEEEVLVVAKWAFCLCLLYAWCL